MACRLHFSLRCPSETPRSSSTCRSRNPSSPILLNLIPSSSNPRKVAYSGARRRRFVTLKAHMTTEEKPVSDDRMLVFVPPHPLIKHWVSVLRNEQTPCPIFRNAMAELGRLLIYEASRDWLPTVSGEIQSPLGVASVEFIDPREPVSVVPILRAGLALMEHASTVLPATKTYHLGMARDEETLLPTVYLNKWHNSGSCETIKGAWGCQQANQSDICYSCPSSPSKTEREFSRASCLHRNH